MKAIILTRRQVQVDASITLKRGNKIIMGGRRKRWYGGRLERSPKGQENEWKYAVAGGVRAKGIL